MTTQEQLTKAKYSVRKRFSSVDFTLCGKTFGFLLVLGYSHSDSSWRCICICGKVKNISASSLTKKWRATKSCGCMTKALQARARTTHGHSKVLQDGRLKVSPEYSFMAFNVETVLEPKP